MLEPCPFSERQAKMVLPSIQPPYFIRDVNVRGICGGGGSSSYSVVLSHLQTQEASPLDHKDLPEYSERSRAVGDGPGVLL